LQQILFSLYATLTAIITGIIIAYSLLTLILCLIWLRIKPGKAPAEGVCGVYPRVSVIVVVRNEEKNIIQLLEDMEKQSFPATHTEVWVVDDHSSDTTAALVAAFSQKATYSLQLLRLAEIVTSSLPGGNYKKKGIELAVARATGELMVCTDGDCRVGNHWLGAIAGFYMHKQPQFISGPVAFYGEEHFFEKLQSVEFASLIGSGAALLQAGIPAMCNGANLAFTKKAFIEVGGYAHTSGTATGDDVFLLQKINRAFPGKALFLQDQQAIVYTKAQKSIPEFVQQRKRWASKWNLYTDLRVSGLAVFIFLSNFCMAVALLLLLTGNYSLRMFLVQIAIKFSAEFVFLTLVLAFLKKLDFVRFIIPLQGIYFLYVSFFGIITHKKGYFWKGRKLR
jgi:cellulose synthase/poly-beta-1,6-N-acetylglucosamine synthase-like glycosyltransferase